MPKYIIDGSTLTGLANAVRRATGETRSYTISEMIDTIESFVENGIYILEDDNGIEIPAAFVRFDEDYATRYYDNGIWYKDADCTEVWEDCPSTFKALIILEGGDA